MEKIIYIVEDFLDKLKEIYLRKWKSIQHEGGDPYLAKD